MIENTTPSVASCEVLHGICQQGAVVIRVRIRAQWNSGPKTQYNLLYPVLSCPHVTPHSDEVRKALTLNLLFLVVIQGSEHLFSRSARTLLRHSVRVNHSKPELVRVLVRACSAC